MMNFLVKTNDLLDKINGYIESLFGRMKQLSDFTYVKVDRFIKQSFALAVFSGIILMVLVLIVSLIKFN
jgi:pantothenate kinase type III